MSSTIESAHFHGSLDSGEQPPSGEFAYYLEPGGVNESRLGAMRAYLGEETVIDAGLVQDIHGSRGEVRLRRQLTTDDKKTIGGFGLRFADCENGLEF